MKSKFILFGLLAFTLCLRAWGQYAIGWHKISGGGGTSVGGQYALSGTIGQHDAGAAMTGGGYAVTGGFWSLVSVIQTAGAPWLTVTNAGGGVIVSWPGPAPGWTLQQNSGLDAAGWTNSGYSVSTNGALNSITISSPTGNLFFRLTSP